jgi:hypothetical protein
MDEQPASGQENGSPASQRVFYIASNFHDAEVPDSIDELNPQVTGMRFPDKVTLGFRGLFWRAFDRLYRQPIMSRPEIEFLGLKWRISSVYLLEVAAHRFPVLNDRQTRFILLVAAQPDTEITSEQLVDHAFASGFDEQAFSRGFLDALAKVTEMNWISTLSHDRQFPGRNQFTFDGRVERPDTASALTGFYFLAQLLIWQSQREIAQLDISLGSAQKRKSIRNALSTRQKVIEIERLFLTKNITNDTSLKAFALRIRKHLRLRTSFDGLLPLNEAIERFHLSASALRQERQAHRLTLIATALAVVGIPISFVSMMMAVSDKSFVVEQGFAAIPDHQVGHTLAVLVGGAGLATLGIALVVWLLTGRR